MPRNTSAQETALILNVIIESDKVQSVPELAEITGLSERSLYDLRKRGMVNLPKVRRGPPRYKYGKIAEELGLVIMLASVGCPKAQIAREIGVTPESIGDFIEKDRVLYSTWRRNRYYPSHN
ncbi:hypothetical protein HY500_03910 [Candidatus Woesearchaeota archaeon]|nr:hypothetical protein [Candidatus Woesearchaeota archaeon]